MGWKITIILFAIMPFVPFYKYLDKILLIRDFSTRPITALFKLNACCHESYDLKSLLIHRPIVRWLINATKIKLPTFLFELRSKMIHLGSKAARCKCGAQPGNSIIYLSCSAPETTTQSFKLSDSQA